ncbi:Beta-glucosidase 24 [Linum grandiflorum]
MAVAVIIFLSSLLLLPHSSDQLGITVDDQEVAPTFSDPCLHSDYKYRPSPELPRGRWNFPDGFVFGSATAAYQIEGASNIHGRGPSVWDRFTHQFPERIDDGSNGDVALNHYNLLKEDIQRMKYMNVDAYRFSISWTRVLPHGKRSDGINEEGIEFYHRLLDLLIDNGIEPYVTIWHWDTPQALEAEYGGFLNHAIVKDFEDYCDLLFQEYGTKVKKWITLNEPMVYAINGYDGGSFAPGRCSAWVNRACRFGNSGVEPYIVTHNLLLAHSAAYHLFKNKYQNLIGKVGITYNSPWYVPYSNSTKDVDAAQRSQDWILGWFMDPITFGHYPRIMVDILGSRLPSFTEQESLMLKHSYDFLGLNYYTAYYAKHKNYYDDLHLRYTYDSQSESTPDKDGVYIGPPLGSPWQFLYPDGLRQLLVYIQNKYKDPVIYITENGLSEKDNTTQSLAEALNDEGRIDFYNSHLTSILRAINENQVKVKGFFPWSYADNFEWNAGYTIRFGLYYIDYKDLSRHPKYSACWYTNFCDKTKSKSKDEDRLITTHDALHAALLGRRALSSA